jgi:hypothetical protein
VITTAKRRSLSPTGKTERSVHAVEGDSDVAENAVQRRSHANENASLTQVSCVQRSPLKKANMVGQGADLPAKFHTS